MRFARPVVIDTGVLVSAAIRPQSVPAMALQCALLHHDVYASTETLAELSEVLLRPKFDRYASVAIREVFLLGLRTHLQLTEVAVQVQECCDPKDDKFLSLAWAVGAELIIASDPHLTQMHPWRSIPILPPAAFLVM